MDTSLVLDIEVLRALGAGGGGGGGGGGGEAVTNPGHCIFMEIKCRK